MQYDFQRGRCDASVVVVVGYNINTQPDTEAPRKIADKMPGFSGGQAALLQYLAESIKYPTITQVNKEQGKVFLRVVIGKKEPYLT